MNVRHKPTESRQKLHLVHRLFIAQVILPSGFEDFLRWSRDISKDGVMQRVVRPLIDPEREHVSKESAVAPIPAPTLEKDVVYIAVVAPCNNPVFTRLTTVRLTLLSFHNNHHPPKKYCAQSPSRQSPSLEACLQSGLSHSSSGHIGQPRQRLAFGAFSRWAFP